MKASLAADGALAKSGLLRIAKSAGYNLDDRFELLSDGFAEAMQHEEGEPLALLGQSVRTSRSCRVDARGLQPPRRRLSDARRLHARGAGETPQGRERVAVGTARHGKTELAASSP